MLGEGDTFGTNGSFGVPKKFRIKDKNKILLEFTLKIGTIVIRFLMEKKHLIFS